MKIKNTLRTKLFWLVSLLILTFRFLYVDLILFLNQKLDISLIEVSATILSHLPLLILLLISVIYLLQILTKKVNTQRQPIRFLFTEILYLTLISVTAAVYIVRDKGTVSSSHYLSWLLYVTVIIFLIILLAAAFINIQFYNKLAQQEELALERKKTFRAVHDYNRLKRQLNPHFLFNSLNVLNSLVRSNPERASSFIQKLARVYRYLLSQEEQHSVPFLEEISFANSYFDLMRERFCEGLELHIDVSDSIMRTYTIPCAIQIQLENAVKHNVVDPANPLIIEIFVENNYLVIRNNIIPKLQSVESSGIGLASIEAQYKMVFNQFIIKEETENYFIVKLPIIYNI